MKRHAPRQIKLAQQMPVQHVPISTQAVNDDQQLISRKSLSFQRTVLETFNEKMNKKKLT